MDAEICVGVVGLGLAATAHIRGYLSHPQARVLAVCDNDGGRAAAFGEQHGIERVYTSYAELVTDGDLHVIDIATPTFLHAEMTALAAEAGKHIHCEKPFCRSVAEGMAAVQAAKKADVKLLVGETYVFLSSHMKARELIEDGAIGRPLQIRQRHGAWHRRAQHELHIDAAARAWRLDGAKSGGGRYPWIFDHAVHFFATAEYLMGDTQIDEVYAVAASAGGGPSRGGAEHDPYRTAEVDIPIITWRYADPERQGVWMRAERLNGKYDFMHGFSTTVVGETGMIEVLGEGGHNLLWQGEQQHLILHREGQETACFRFDEGGDRVWASEISYYGKGHVNQVHHLIDAIRQNSQVRYGGEDGVRAVRCTLAAIRSAQEGRPVPVAEVEESYKAYE
ncbi:MAG: Gfo/Idh/MocA family oxidoreductase [Caldilineaceae bacterium]|nr:Gfo/Idh/MocA family oxidoreductase [Caldilineaceae bacterium]